MDMEYAMLNAKRSMLNVKCSGITQFQRNAS